MITVERETVSLKLPTTLSIQPIEFASDVRYEELDKDAVSFSCHRTGQLLWEFSTEKAARDFAEQIAKYLKSQEDYYQERKSLLFILQQLQNKLLLKWDLVEGEQYIGLVHNTDEVIRLHLLKNNQYTITRKEGVHWLSIHESLLEDRNAALVLAITAYTSYMTKLYLEEMI